MVFDEILIFLFLFKENKINVAQLRRLYVLIHSFVRNKSGEC